MYVAVAMAMGVRREQRGANGRAEGACGNKRELHARSCLSGGSMGKDLVVQTPVLRREDPPR